MKKQVYKNVRKWFIIHAHLIVKHVILLNYLIFIVKFARLLLCKVVLSFFFTLTFWEGDHCMACFKELKSYAHLLRVDFKRLNSRNNCSLGLDIPHTLLSSKINVIFTAKNKAPHFINQIKLVLMSDYLFSIQHKICGDVLNENQHSCGLKSSTAFVRDFLKEGTQCYSPALRRKMWSVIMVKTGSVSISRSESTDTLSSLFPEFFN